MSPTPLPADPYEIAREALALAEKADAELARVCKNDFKMRVAIPARPGVDSDLIFSDAFEACRTASAALVTREDENKRLIAAIQNLLACFDLHTNVTQALVKRDPWAALRDVEQAVRAARSAQ
jgi:hypothetical protein